MKVFLNHQLPRFLLYKLTSIKEYCSIIEANKLIETYISMTYNIDNMGICFGDM